MTVKKLRVSLTVLVGILVAPLAVYAVVNSLNGQTGATQTFSNDSNVTISSSGDVHSLGWSGLLPISRGGTGQSSFTTGSLLFAGSSSISEDNTNLFWDNGSKILFLPAIKSSTSLSIASGISGPLSISSGWGNETDDGGHINITAGDGGVTSGNGGAIDIHAGNSGLDPAIGDGGAISLVAGLAGDDGAGGAVTIFAGDGGSTAGDSGSITIRAGTTPGGGLGQAGSLNLLSGSSGGGITDSGDVNIVGADHDLNNPGIGGDVSIVAGAAGEASTGGAIDIKAGNGGSLVRGTGGGVAIAAGSALIGDSNGGNIEFRVGAGFGAGIPGEYRFAKASSLLTGTLSFEALTASRAFIFPDYSGTFGLLEADQVFTGFNKFEATASSSIKIGSSTKTGCIVMGDSDGSGVTYVTANNGVLSASSVKPGICQ